LQTAAASLEQTDIAHKNDIDSIKGNINGIIE
jgi:hypothetical protein